MGSKQRFLSWLEPTVIPPSMRWLPNPTASRDVEMVDKDPRLLFIVFRLSWGSGPRRTNWEEVLVVAR